MCMTKLSASLDLLIGQWVDSPRLRNLIDAFLDRLRKQALPAIERLALMRLIDKAEGTWLDHIGSRLGLRRPSTTSIADDKRMGFTGVIQARGFDQVPFAGREENEAVFPLPDAMYRRFLMARAILLFDDGTTQTYSRAVQSIDPAATVQDDRDMTIRIFTDTAAYLMLGDQVGATPRTAGVNIRYLTQSSFGFDSAGIGFNQVPFRATT